MIDYRDNYNFIIASGTNEFYRYVYQDVNKLDYAYFENGIPVSKILRLLMKAHFSNKTNRIFSLPLKSVWGKVWVAHWKKILKREMNAENKKMCFILFADLISLEDYGLSRLIRKSFPDCRIVYFYQDLVRHDPNKLKLIERKIPDFIISFDPRDAEKYGLKYHNVPYSKLRNEFPSSQLESDICFIGRAKDRLNQIVDAYIFFSSQGLKCDFYITDVPEEARVHSDKIHYCEPMSYDTYLNIMVKSKCILEIMQKGGAGNTLRTNEAVEFNKILITNNESLVKNALYDERYMFVYKDIHQLDCKKIEQLDEVRYNNRELMSVEGFLEDIARELQC